MIKKYVLYLLSVLVLGGIWFGLSTISKDGDSNGLKPITLEFRRLEIDGITDVKLSPNEQVFAKDVLNGGPYILGEQININGIVVSVEEIGWDQKLYNSYYLTTEGTEIKENDLGISVFKVSIINKTTNQYDISLSDFSIAYTDINGNLIEQDFSTSGYNNWKYLEGSFKEGILAPNNEREGYLFIPTTNKVTNGGTIELRVNKVPVKFSF